MSFPDWTRAPTYPAGYTSEFAYTDAPAPDKAIQWCALADAPKTQTWSRSATCYLAKPGVDTNKPWDPANYYQLDKAACQKYMDKTTHKLPAYQSGTYTPVTYAPVDDNGTFWPQLTYKPPAVNQCASVLSIDAWAGAPQ